MAPWPCSCQRRKAFDSAEEDRQRGSDHVKRGEFDQAVEAFSRAIKRRPKDAGLWLSRSIAFQQKQDWEQSERDAARAAELQPTSESAAYGRAHALHKLRRIEEALDVCGRFLRTDPDSKLLLQFRKVLEAEQKQAERGPAGRAAPEPADKPERKKHDIDYSKWADLEDSDEEREKERKAKEWKGKNPSVEERLAMTEQMLELCRSTAEETAGLFPNSREPENVQLPPGYGSSVGLLSVAQLGEFNSKSSRQLVSIYGDVFDVSSRPDQYGVGGPKAFQAGKDITWAVITGKEVASNCNRFYDIFKLDDDHCGRFLQILCQRMVAFENEFGGPIGRLDPFADERDLPPAPAEEIEECRQQ